MMLAGAYKTFHSVLLSNHENTKRTQKARIVRGAIAKKDRCFRFIRKNRSKRLASGRLGKCHLERPISSSNSISKIMTHTCTESDDW
jgi:hypothetical protein